MPTILELANESGVSADQVLRVVNGEPVSEAVDRRVRAAMERLGRPAYPKPGRPPVEPAPTPAAELDRGLARLTTVAATSETTLPAEVGTVVYEALRVEVRPVAEHLAGLESLLVGGGVELRRGRHDVPAERRDRVRARELQIELLRASWAGVDRRLGRIERALARREEPTRPASALSRIEDVRPAELVPVRDASGS